MSNNSFKAAAKVDRARAVGMVRAVADHKAEQERAAQDMAAAAARARLCGPDGEAVPLPPLSEPEVSFAERLVDAISELIDAKLDYAEARRGQAAEYASSEQVRNAAGRIEDLLRDVRVVGKLA